MVAIGGCSTSQTPDTSSTNSESLSSESPSPGNAIETSANTTLAQVKQYEDVPQAFQGVWQADLEQCSSQASETRLEIGPNQIQFYESQGPIKEVVSDGKTTLKVKVELSGEGETWLSEREFQLSEDQNTLTAIDGDNALVRYRCANSTLAQVKQYQDVPQVFQGVWQADLEQCSSQASETRLEIGPNQIQFYESQGPIKEVVSDGKTTLKVKVELSGEGETWLSEREFQLSEDQNTLTAISDDNAFARYRCS
ncbi:hypothetical protein [Acaryochloris marina]|uniref:hypothetical protein n=1 Tax=Acaryochloris marina TaxID=155978 RepID=UPI0021C49C74|nr:hypothetical protein [Acaryochloris marina]BDM79195.1 hypothetical protein AM10699_20630 [Acaryochloris marina MBIC10699]